MLVVAAAVEVTAVEVEAIEPATRRTTAKVSRATCPKRGRRKWIGPEVEIGFLGMAHGGNDVSGGSGRGGHGGRGCGDRACDKKDDREGQPCNDSSAQPNRYTIF